MASSYFTFGKEVLHYYAYFLRFDAYFDGLELRNGTDRNESKVEGTIEKRLWRKEYMNYKEQMV